MVQTGSSGRRGRPRSEAVRAAVLSAAAELALAGGPAAATVDAIARRAEVSRTTIYKWWPSASAIVLEGLLDAVRDSITRPAGSTSVEAVIHHVTALNALLTDPAVGPLLRNVIAASASDHAIERAVLAQWIVPRRAAVNEIVREAVARGELASDSDVEGVVDALVSPPYYRLVLGMSPLDDDAITRLVQTVWRGCLPGRR
ncbi:TetR family transcriptional regulator [Mycolicibacterium duvalii]|uniref:Putative HTH-type transcriptional regulator YdeS n=1 Tax=Mycolicibacterium duvalii TaxID=39688 RepID=A0A7I7K7R7_9MYCO|nr:TetR-like C-terminal domain-containing protein [Mycolicibacterium duvalii]MCV7366297.1 TetR/AcrR family transcriptional regulator C-terminal ligand-binding domain-containing protein [Mycolicibacterium duvalii]PEG41025.1 TetR family transcriptional regulator [Mycolicibacterium duvalii]BBX20125.1 putative HTH-type transcriptional regulator YdeS [Mycolicibacterium duvalii]